MTTYNTGNPVPSGNAKDRYDNSQTFDQFINGTLTHYKNRIGNNVLSLKGMADLFNAAQSDRTEKFEAMEADFKADFEVAQEWREDAFNQLLINTQFEMPPIPYQEGAPIEISRPSQLISYEGQLYSVKLPASFPFQLSGIWSVAVVSLTPREDLSLKQRLANPAEGARLIGWVRSVITDTEKSVQSALSAQKHNLHEFSDFIVSKPNPTNPKTWDWTPAIQMATDHVSLIGGGEIFAPAGTYLHTTINMKPNVSYSGEGLNVTKFVNTGSGHAFQWLGTTSNRLPSFHMTNLSITGKPGSLDGIHIEWLARRGTAVVLFSSVGITEHGRDGMYVEYADAISFVACEVSRNARDGFSAFSGSNQMNFFNGAICGNGRDGYFINQIVSSCVLYGVAVHDNGGRGVRALRAEQPMLMNVTFNRNAAAAVAFLGGIDDLKDVEAGVIFACLFGDNNPSGSDIELNRVTTVLIETPYFFNVSETKASFIRISGRADGVIIRNPRRKSSVANLPETVSTDGNPNVRYTIEDTGAVGALHNTTYVGIIHQYLMSFASSIVFQTRVSQGSAAPLFSLDASGRMSWGSGDAAADVSLSRVTAGSLTVDGGMRMRSLMLAEQSAQPTAQAGHGRMYFDQVTQTFKAVLPSGAVRTFSTT